LSANSEKLKVEELNVITAIIRDKVKFLEEVVTLCLLTVQSIEMESDVLGFEVSVNDLVETEIMLRVENVPNDFIGFLLRQEFSSRHQLVQVAVTVF
jgi:hypothetical protein